MKLYFRLLGLCTSFLVSYDLKDKKMCPYCNQMYSQIERIPILGYFIHQRKCGKCKQKKDIKIVVCELLNYVCYELILGVPISMNEKLVYALFITLCVMMILRVMKRVNTKVIFIYMILLMLTSYVLIQEISLVHRFIGVAIGMFIWIVFYARKKLNDLVWLFIGGGFIFSDSAFLPIILGCIILSLIHDKLLSKFNYQFLSNQSSAIIYLMCMCMVQIIYGVYISVM